MSKELEALEQLNNKIDASTKEGKEQKSLVDAAIKEQKELKDQVQKLNDEFAEVKGAVIKDLQDEVKELKAKSGRLATTVLKEEKGVWVGKLIQDAITEHKEALPGKLQEINPLTGKKGLTLVPTMEERERYNAMTEAEKKSVGPILSANLGTDNYVNYLDWQPGMEPTGQFHFRNLVRTISSDIDFVQFPRANTPIGEGSFQRTDEGSTKPQIDRDYTMVNLTLKPMAGYTILSRQSLRNIRFLQSWLPVSLMDQLQDNEDQDFVNTLLAAATGTASGSIGSGSALISKLVGTIKNLRKAKYNPNGIAMDPDAWSEILLNVETNAGFNLPRVVTVAEDGTVRILGRPVYDVNWLSNGMAIVGDWTRAAIVQSEGLVMRQTDSHASTFTANEVTWLLERTEGLAIFRPDAFAKLDLVG